MEQETLSMLKAALRQLQQYREAELRLHEPLAIVGMAARFPGGHNLKDFWQQLLAGTDAVTQVPAARWRVQDYYDAIPGTPGKTYTMEGAFLADVDLFDAAFFGISPVEALAMDPQQRLMLETTWRAFEDAGFLPGSAPDTGVFVGVSGTEYVELLKTAVTDARTLPYFSTGNVLNAIPGRVAYQFGFKGPCLAVDTACSSSLVALHLACKSVRQGECRQAVVGGVNLQLLPFNTIAVSQTRMLSKDGRCKAFDASADGYGRGEGCGTVIIKTLSDAIRDHDRIHALLLGSAVNHNGGGSGFTVPDSITQQRLMRAAIADAGVDPAHIGYIEAHGTGTSLGDPIEWSAMAAVYGTTPGRQKPLYTSTVKTNIGHLEAAAGIAGLIKTVLTLKHGIIPAHLHLHDPNPHIAWSVGSMEVPLSRQDWEENAHARLAAVSSFGFSGTNAHAILEAVPPVALPSPGEEESVSTLLTFSAHTPVALREQVQQCLEWLQQPLQVSISVFGKALQRLNPDREYRKAFTATQPDGFVSQLTAFLAEEVVAPLPVKRQPVLLLSGYDSRQAVHYRRLYAELAAFRVLADRYFSLLLVDHPDESLPDMSPVATTIFNRRSTFVLEYALANLLLSWGLTPEQIYAVNDGRYTAAAVAGILSPAAVLQIIDAHTNGSVNPELIDRLASQLSAEVLFPVMGIGGELTTLLQRPDYWLAPSFPQEEKISAHTLTNDQLWINIGQEQPATAAAWPVRSAAEVMSLTGHLYECGYPIHWQSVYEHVPVAVLEDMPVYSFQRQRYWPAVPVEEKVSALPVYDKQWEPVVPEMPVAKTTLLQQCWVLLEPGGHSAAAAALSAQGLAFVQVSYHPGPAGESIYKLKDGKTGQLKELLQDISTVFGEVTGLIDMNLLHLQGVVDGYDGITSTAQYLKSLTIQLNELDIPKLEVVLCTSGDEGSGDMVSAVAAAICRVMNHELALCQVRHISLPVTVSTAEWEQWGYAILHTKETEIQIKESACWQPVFVPAVLSSAGDAALFDAAAMYLVTGASGAIGQQLLEWMIAQGARHLLLVSRNGYTTPEQQLSLQRYRQNGVAVTVYQADVSDVGQVCRLLQSLHTSQGPVLKGIFHVAGITDDDLLYRQDAARFQSVLAVKAAAAWHLHKHTQSLALDYFVMFSSSASSLGISGQGSYAAANAALDALVRYRRARSLSGLSICWGPWEIGMTTRLSPAYKQLLAANGVGIISPEAAFSALAALLRNPSMKTPLVIAADTQALNKVLQAGVGNTNLSAGSRRIALPFFEDHRAAYNWILQYLREKMVAITGLSSSQLYSDQPLVSQGLDSLMAVRLQQQVADDTGCTIHIAEVLQGASLVVLAKALCQQLEKPAIDVAAIGHITAGDVEGITDDKVEALLKNMLGH